MVFYMVKEEYLAKMEEYSQVSGKKIGWLKEKCLISKAQQEFPERNNSMHKKIIKIRFVGTIRNLLIMDNSTINYHKRRQLREVNAQSFDF